MFGWKKAAERWEASAEAWKKSSAFWTQQAFAQRALNLELLEDLAKLLPQEAKDAINWDEKLQMMKDFQEKYDPSKDSQEAS